MGVDVDQLKDRTRAMWTLGEYAEIARYTEAAARELVDACAISAGQEVLDVAAGTGNLAVLAAREGARVVASDLTPAMVEQGRARCGAEGLDVEWVEADAEALPFDDRSFDCAASVFGAMFAPRPEVAAGELFRVVRPGGTVGMANWTPDGFQGEMFALTARYLPPPESLPRPVEWGDEDTVAARFEGLAASLELERRALRWAFASPGEMADFFGRNAGPSVAMRSALDDDRVAALRAELVELIERWNAADDGSVAIDADYLLVVARRRG